MIARSRTTAAKAGGAMVLSSPVASLVPILVLNAVVTFKNLAVLDLRRSRLEEYPCCANRAVV
jgi:hypothetical protein